MLTAMKNETKKLYQINKTPNIIKMFTLMSSGVNEKQ